MGTIFDTGTGKIKDVTIDESLGLQTGGTATSTEDNNDNDILLSSIGTLLTTLDNLGAPAAADAIEAAQNRVLTFVSSATPTSSPTLTFRLFDGPDSNGSDSLKNSELSTLTTTADADGDGNPDPITLVRINDTTIFGYANYGSATSRVAFALALQPVAPTSSDPGGANITIVQYEALHNPTAGDGTNHTFDEAVDLTGLVFVDAVQDVSFDNFKAAPAGQNDWISVTDANTGIQILATGLHLGVDTVNTSEFALGSNSQSIVIGDGLVFDFVKGQTAPSQTTADDITKIDFTSRVEGPSAGFSLVQTGGNAANRVGAQVTAFDSSEVGSDYGDGTISAPSQTIVGAEIWLGSTKVSSWVRGSGVDPSSTDPNVTFASNADGSVTIQGLLVNYRVEFHVGVVDGDDTGKLDRFSVKNVSSGGAANDTFDLGHIHLGGQVGDSADIGSHLRFEDDGPSAVAALSSAGAVTHDETAGVQSAAGADDTASDLSALFSGIGTVSTDLTAAYAQGSASILDTTGINYGRDSAGASSAYALTLSIDGTDSGLKTTDGHDILLHQVSDSVVVGRIAGGADDGKAAFAVSINTGTGVLSLAQYASLEHLLGGASNPNDAVSIATGKLFAVLTATDGDGDTAKSSNVDIGSSVSFLDDAPTAAAALSSAGAVTHDETAGVQSAAGADDTASDLSALFSGIGTVSTDLTAAYAQGSASILDPTGTAYGQDQEGASSAYALTLSAADVYSGLNTTDGHQILLHQVSDSVVVGRIAGGADDGKAAFAVSINTGTGVLSLAQYASLEHLLGGASNPNDAVSIATGKLFAVLTATDGDGDTAKSSNVDIGSSVSFLDDAPTAAAALSSAGAVTHDETAGVQSADGANDTATDLSALFSGIGTVSSDLTAAYAQGSASILDTTGTAYGQDQEGASSAYALTLSIDGTDSGLNTTDGHQILLHQVSDSVVVGRIVGGTDDGKAAFAVSINTSTGILSLAQYASLEHLLGGASNPNDAVSIATGKLFAVLTATDGDGDTAKSSNVDIGSSVTFLDDAPTAAAALSSAGAVTHDETAGVQSADGADDTASDLSALFSGIGTVSSDMTAAYAQGSASILDPTGTAYGQDQEGASSAYALTLSIDGTDSGLNTTDGHDIRLHQVSDSVVVGRIAGGADDGKAAFAVSINTSTGVLSLAQYASLEHLLGGASNPNDAVSIATGKLFAVLTATDGDGDTAKSSNVDIGSSVSFLDDAPTAAAALSSAGAVTHDETAGVQSAAGANDTATDLSALFSGIGTVSTDLTAAYAQGNASILDPTGTAYGQDQEGASSAYALTLSIDGTDSGLNTTDGHDIRLYQVSDSVVVGRIAGGADDGKAAFAVSINTGTGVLSLAQYASLEHLLGGANNPNDAVSIATGKLFAVLTATDGDGDTAKSSNVDIGSSVSFLDDAPSAISPAHAHVTNAAGLPASFALDDGTPANFADNFGQDGAGAYGGVVFAGTSANDGTALTDTDGNALTSNQVAITLSGFGTNVLTAMAGATKVFTVTLDGSTGHYSVDMDAQIDNGALSFNKFGSGGAGLRYWLGVAGDQDANKDLLITGGDPLRNPVNNDSDDIGIGNQWIDPKELVRIDLVDSITNTGGSFRLTGIPQPAHHYDGNDVGFTVMQTKAHSLVDVQISAIDAARDISGTTSADIKSDLLAGTADQIISVSVLDGTTDIKTAYARSDAIKVGDVWQSSDGKVIWDDNKDANGLNDAKYVIVHDIDAPSSSARDQVFVSTADGFSRLEVMNVDAHKQDALAIGGFEIGGHAGAPVDIALNVNVVDGDGDTAIGVVGVTFDPAVV